MNYRTMLHSELLDEIQDQLFVNKGLEHQLDMERVPGRVRILKKIVHNARERLGRLRAEQARRHIHVR